MAFDPRKISILEVAGVVTIILSAILLACIRVFHLVMAGSFELAETAGDVHEQAGTRAGQGVCSGGAG